MYSLGLPKASVTQKLWQKASKKRTCAKGILVLELLTEQLGARWPAAMAATLLRPKKVHRLYIPLGRACTGLLCLQISKS